MEDQGANRGLKGLVNEAPDLMLPVASRVKLLEKVGREEPGLSFALLPNFLGGRRGHVVCSLVFNRAEELLLLVPVR